MKKNSYLMTGGYNCRCMVIPIIPRNKKKEKEIIKQVNKILRGNVNEEERNL